MPSGRSPRRAWGSSPAARGRACTSCRATPSRAAQPLGQPRRLDVVERHPVHARCSAVGSAQRVGVLKDVRPVHLVVELVEAEGGLLLRLEIELRRRFLILSGVARLTPISLRPSPAWQACQKSGPFPPRWLRRLHRYYGPVRLPIDPRRPGRRCVVGDRPGLSRWQRASTRAVAITPAAGAGHSVVPPAPRRPSPLCWRLGDRDFAFEACSAFTRVTARVVAPPAQTGV